MGEKSFITSAHMENMRNLMSAATYWRKPETEREEGITEEKRKTARRKRSATFRES